MPCLHAKESDDWDGGFLRVEWTWILYILLLHAGAATFAFSLVFSCFSFPRYFAN